MVTRRTKANALRALSMDAVQQAKSGHPGMPMGMADIAEVLWSDFLRYNPSNPDWADRDRFVLSNGHGSMLLYALLYLTGYALPLKELRNFRQLHSATPGHPEFGCAPGVETTTGPLGQGLGNAVGMALGEKVLSTQFNRPGHTIVDHRTYVFLGDGCLMEGVSHEACSLAGTLGLGKLIAIWDNNGISIDGEVDAWFTDNTAQRFRAYGWQVIEDVDGHDADSIARALEQAGEDSSRPTLLCCRTVIGWGSPNKQGRESSHGAPLGEDEVALVRETIDWPHAPFEIPEEVIAAWCAREVGAAREMDWSERFTAYRTAHPALAAEYERRINGDLPIDWPVGASTFINSMVNAGESVASRQASRQALDGFGPMLPELIGGSADLAGSNLTIWSGASPITADDARGNYIYFGVREFGMSAMTNGLALHGGFLPYCATFLVFSDYARNAIRLSALMKIRAVFIYTHDSIGLGEDGPTHQPIEHAEALRVIPNLSVWRPCDSVETAIAWQAAIERRDGPTALLLSRQGLAFQARSSQQLADVRRGGYVLHDGAGPLDAIIIATGSEVSLAMAAVKNLEEMGHSVRVVSLPSTDIFDRQEAAYRDKVLPPMVTVRVAVEAGVSRGWFRYVGTDGQVIGLDTYGESAPAKTVFEHFGFTVDNVVGVVSSLIRR
ncbi:transketolase [Gammaproteobacteria bacterium]|nr:transketolase [Gammaproteobacteria bacterium]